MIPIAALALALASTPVAEDHGIPYTKFVLDNGLQVIVHEDHTSPIVTICVCYHVGSAREERGKTGLAHLFEHMLFKGSEHVPDGDHARLIEEVGGYYQGKTSRDTTYYYETLPAAALELGLWLESDRMGFLDPNLKQAKLDNVIDVVRNERRQELDNVDVRRLHERALALLFPSEHPYSWDTYGSHDDLASVTLDDARAFWRAWYGPNNATLAIGGDVDANGALKLVEKYFGTIAVREVPPTRDHEVVHLRQDLNDLLEDDVRSPFLLCAWPLGSVEGLDDAALHVLELIVAEDLRLKLIQTDPKAESVSVDYVPGELGASFEIRLKALPNGSLDDLEGELRQKMIALLEGGIDDLLLERLRNQVRTALLGTLDSVSACTLLLAQSNAVDGTPDRTAEVLYWLSHLTPTRLNEVLRDRLIRRPRIVISLVPHGKLKLAYLPSIPVSKFMSKTADFFSLDRARKPEVSTTSTRTGFPDIWHFTADNGLVVSGITRPLFPLCSVSLDVPLGPEYEGTVTRGMLSRLACMGMTGLFGRESQHSADRWKTIGAEFHADQFTDLTRLSATFEPTHLSEVLANLSLAVRSMNMTSADLHVMKSEVDSALYSADWTCDGGSSTLHRQMYGLTSPLGSSTRECRQALTDLNIDAIDRYWHEHVNPHRTSLSFVGPLTADELRKALPSLVTDWNDTSPPPDLPSPSPSPTKALRICFHKVSKSPQVTIEIAQVAVLADPQDECALTVGLEIMGTLPSSRLPRRLREQLGLTYDCKAWLEKTEHSSAFRCYAQVDATEAPKALEEMMKVIRAMSAGPSSEELARAKTRNKHRSMLKYATRAQCLSLLQDTHGSAQLERGAADWDAQVESLTTDRIREVFARCIDPNRFVVILSGDSASICEPLEKLGFGSVSEVDENGDPISVSGSASKSR